MASMWASRNRLVRGLVALAVVIQVLTWFANLFLFPSALITVVAGVTGARRIERDDDDAVLRIGVALLTSLVASVLAVFSGALAFVVVAWSSSGLLLAAWVLLRALAADRRRSWGIKQQDILRRRLELEQRRDALRDHRDG